MLIICIQASSPTDSALDFMKRKRLNQLAAKQQQQLQQQQKLAAEKQQQPQPSISFGISDCDLGASPNPHQGSLISKMAHNKVAMG